ncbi:metallophosphoesterase [Chryseobacterium aureum]|uniref:metallophosphoesterase n=1 Tax=Chryseobacterium aureum TaxID=2497456 RepID=UPI000F898D89|nr:metallophosphoesterase [Chryseobacterium aureum]
MGRILITSDNHGALKAVKQVLERCSFNPNEDLLINLGDVVDRGTESAELVQLYIDLSEECLYKPLFIRGNHDVFCQEWLKGGIPKMEWLMQGGKATVESYINTGYTNEESHLNFFNEMFDFYIDTKNRGYVHAGFTSHQGLGYDSSDTYYWDRSLWKQAMDNKTEQLPKEFRIFEVHKEIFIGHTPTLNWDETEPINKYNIWNLDTGAGYGEGKLSIMDANSKEFWQSDTIEELYSDKKQSN